MKSVMKSFIILVYLAIQFLRAQNRMLSGNYVTISTYVENTLPNESENANSDKVLPIQNYDDGEKLIPIQNYDDGEKLFSISNDDGEEYEVSTKKQTQETTKKPCVVVVLSNLQNPTKQSLLRRYRYDSNGVLIPNSVKYFIKLPQGIRSSPLLVPLNDKAISPQGGFVRYYKEVPPIPHMWD